MTFYDWIPGISTSVLLGFVLWLSRSLVMTRLTKSVQHEFDEKLEVIRSDFRKAGELYKAELASKESQLAVLRNYVVSGMSGRQVVVEKRRVEAVEQLWDSVLNLGGLKHIASVMAKVNFEAALKYAESDPNVRKFFEDMAMGFDAKNMRPCNASKARPFLSQMSWALYEAYRSILYQAFIKFQMARSGLNQPEIIERTRIKELLKLALPHQVKFIEECSDGDYFYLVDELESLVLVELDKMLQGVDSDRASMERASEIIKAVGLLNS